MIAQMSGDEDRELGLHLLGSLSILSSMLHVGIYGSERLGNGTVCITVALQGAVRGRTTT